MYPNLYCESFTRGSADANCTLTVLVHGSDYTDNPLTHTSLSKGPFDHCSRDAIKGFFQVNESEGQVLMFGEVLLLHFVGLEL